MLLNLFILVIMPVVSCVVSSCPLCLSSCPLCRFIMPVESSHHARCFIMPVVSCHARCVFSAMRWGLIVACLGAIGLFISAHCGVGAAVKLQGTVTQMID